MNRVLSNDYFITALQLQDTVRYYKYFLQRCCVGTRNSHADLFKASMIFFAWNYLKDLFADSFQGPFQHADSPNFRNMLAMLVPHFAGSLVVTCHDPVLQ